MEISPIDIVKLIFYALVFGMMCGVFNDLNRLVRAFLGEINDKYRTSLYSKKIPVLKRTLTPIKLKGKLGKTLLTLMIAVQDILLFIFAGVGCAVLDFYFNMGRGRIYSVIALIIGFLVYYFTVGRVSVRAFDTVIFLLRATFAVIFGIILTPIYIIGRFLCKNIKKTWEKVYKAIAKKIKMLYNNIMKKNNSGSEARDVKNGVKSEASK